MLFFEEKEIEKQNLLNIVWVKQSEVEKMGYKKISARTCIG